MDDISPEDLQAILAGGGSIAEAQARLEQQKQLAAMLKGAAPQLGLRDAGRTVRASNPLEVAASIGNAYMQKKNMDQQAAINKDIAAQKTAQNNAVLAMLLRKRQMNSPASPTVPTGPNSLLIDEQ